MQTGPTKDEAHNKEQTEMEKTTVIKSSIKSGKRGSKSIPLICVPECSSEGPNWAEQLRVINASAPMGPSEVERPIREPQRSQRGIERRIRAPQLGRNGIERPIRVPQRSRSSLERSDRRRAANSRASEAKAGALLQQGRSERTAPAIRSGLERQI